MLLLLSSDIGGLVGLYKETGGMLIAVGFACAGMAVVKKVINNHERTKEAIITYLLALVLFYLVWELI